MKKGDERFELILSRDQAEWFFKHGGSRGFRGLIDLALASEKQARPKPEQALPAHNPFTPEQLIWIREHGGIPYIVRLIERDMHRPGLDQPNGLQLKALLRSVRHGCMAKVGNTEV
jgi:hypothetical protein